MGMKGQDQMHVLDGTAVPAFFRSSGDTSTQAVAAYAVEAVSTKGCIGCLVDGFEHTCGFTSALVVPSRWLRSRRY